MKIEKSLFSILEKFSKFDIMPDDTFFKFDEFNEAQTHTLYGTIHNFKLLCIKINTPSHINKSRLSLYEILLLKASHYRYLIFQVNNGGLSDDDFQLIDSQEYRLINYPN